MAFGSSFGSFVEGFDRARLAKKGDAEREAGNVMNDRLLGIMEKQASMPQQVSAPAPAMGAIPGGAGPRLSYGAEAPAKLPTGERATLIRNGLTARGMPETVADAFMLNFQDESGLDSSVNEASPIVPGSRGGFGLYQVTGPRRVSLEAMAKERGVDPGDMDLQLDHLMSELGGSEKSAAKRIYAEKTTGGAAQAIAKHFLRPAPEHLASRSARYGAYDQLVSMGVRRPTAQGF